jgi:hypothetical protein
MLQWQYDRKKASETKRLWQKPNERRQYVIQTKPLQEKKEMHLVEE